MAVNSKLVIIILLQVSFLSCFHIVLTFFFCTQFQAPLWPWTAFPRRHMVISVSANREDLYFKGVFFDNCRKTLTLLVVISIDRYFLFRWRENTVCLVSRLPKQLAPQAKTPPPPFSASLRGRVKIVEHSSNTGLMSCLTPERAKHVIDRYVKVKQNF